MTTESLIDCLNSIDRFLEAIKDGAYPVTDGLMNTASVHLCELRVVIGDVTKQQDLLSKLLSKLLKENANLRVQMIGLNKAYVKKDSKIHKLKKAKVV